MSDNDLKICTNSLVTIMVVINHRNILKGLDAYTRATPHDHKRSGSASPEPKDASTASLNPCERSPTSPNPEGTGSASPDPEGDLHFARPQGNGLGCTDHRDVGPSWSHGMIGHDEGQTSSAGVAKDVRHNDLWRGHAITASPVCPPHRRLSRKMR
jgi:hypothetical protein